MQPRQAKVLNIRGLFGNLEQSTFLHTNMLEYQLEVTPFAYINYFLLSPTQTLKTFPFLYNSLLHILVMSFFSLFSKVNRSSLPHTFSISCLFQNSDYTVLCQSVLSQTAFYMKQHLLSWSVLHVKLPQYQTEVNNLPTLQAKLIFLQSQIIFALF